MTKKMLMLVPVLFAAQLHAADGKPATHRYLVERSFPAGALKGLDAATKAKVNANNASVDVAKASRHIRNLSAALDNPRTVADLQATLSNAKQLTDRWSAVGGDVRKLTDDPKFVDGIRNVSVGLGQFFAELYPAQTSAAKDRDERKRAEREQAGAAATPAAP